MVLHKRLDELFIAARAVHCLGKGLVCHELSGWTHHLLLDVAVAPLHEEDIMPN